MLDLVTRNSDVPKIATVLNHCAALFPKREWKFTSLGEPGCSVELNSYRTGEPAFHRVWRMVGRSH